MACLLKWVTRLGSSPKAENVVVDLENRPVVDAGMVVVTESE